MNELVEKLKIQSKEVLVDNGEQGFWNQSWYETRYGLVDSNGYFVIPAIFADIAKSEDMFIATYQSKGGKKIFFINSIGKVVANNLNIINAKEFKNGCCLVQTADIFSGGHNVPWTYVSNLCKWGLIDKFGNILVEPKYNYEYEVKIEDTKLLIHKIKLDGCEILNYAYEKLFSTTKNVKRFKKAMKYYLLNFYAVNQNKNSLKIELDKQNKEFKKIKFRKLAENIFSTNEDSKMFRFFENRSNVNEL